VTQTGRQVNAWIIEWMILSEAALESILSAPKTETLVLQAIEDYSSMVLAMSCFQVRWWLL
jgi:hypothetical protein